MRRLGFHGARRTPTGPDEGVDVIAPMAIAQVKKQASKVGRPAVQQLIGAGPRNCARLFYSASEYARPARELAEGSDIALFVYDLPTQKIDAVSSKAIELEHAAGYPGIPDGRPANVGEGQRARGMPNVQASSASPVDANAYFPPAPVSAKAGAASAVEMKAESPPYLWYFAVAVLTVGGFAWIAFLHAYRRTRSPLWGGWAIGFGVWCPLLYSVTAAMARGSSTAGGTGGISPGESLLSWFAIGAAVVACALLATARQEVMALDEGRRPESDTTSWTEAEDPAHRQWVRPGPGRMTGSFLWALGPALTLSLGTPWLFLAAAIRRRTFLMWACFGFYLGLFLWFFAMPVDISRTPWMNLYMVVSWIAATVHALLIRRYVWYRRTASAGGAHPPLGS